MNYKEIEDLGNIYSESVMGKDIDNLIVESARPSLKVKRKPETDEWVVIYTDENGKRDEDKCYYTDDKEDAEGTKAKMQEEIDEKFPVNEDLMSRVGARLGALKDTAKSAADNVKASAKNVASTMAGEKPTAKGTNLKYKYEQGKAQRAIDFHMNKLKNQLSKFATDMVKLGIASEQDAEKIAQQAYSAIGRVNTLKKTKNLFDVEDN